jgi:hypothetical protein
MDFTEIRRNRSEPNSKIRRLLFTISNFQNIRKKYYKKLEIILSILVKNFFQINNVCLVKIQIESNMWKWAHMAHHAQKSYFFSGRFFCEIRLIYWPIRPNYRLVQLNFGFHEFSCCFRVQNELRPIFTEFYENRRDRLHPIFLLPPVLLTLLSTIYM